MVARHIRGKKKDYQLGRELAPIEIVCCAVGKKEESLHIPLSTKVMGPEDSKNPPKCYISIKPCIGVE